MLKILIAGMVLLIAGAGVILWFYWRFDAQMRSDIARMTKSAETEHLVVTSELLEGLPEPARRHLEFAGIVGKPIPRVVRLTQAGRIRSSAQATWKTFEAEEVYSTNPPAFVWRAWFPRRAAPVVLGRDVYLEGRGSILMKMLALWPVAEESADDLGPAGLMRYLNEMMWFPAAFLAPNVTISAVSEDAFDVTLEDRGMTATARMSVDPQGRLTNFTARRFNTSTRTMEVWETPMTGYGYFDGLNLPTAGAAVWKLGTGDFTYIELEVTQVTYDPPAGG